MFACRACMRRAYSALLFDATPATSSTVTRGARPPEHERRPSSSRWYSNTASKQRQMGEEKLAASRPMPGRQYPRYEAKRNDRNPHEQAGSRRHNTSNEGAIENGPPKSADKDVTAASESKYVVPTEGERRRMNRSLMFLVDPLKFHNHVKDLLFKRRNVDSALKLVRYASKSRQCVIVWNEIIKWHLANNRPNAAIQLYNEMKKRDQWPDSYTYMHLIRGLADYWQHSTMLGKALNIYHSMSAENSRVEPRTVHTNMALKICARAGDMDALWGVASRLPEKGSKSADGITYSIILNAIRRQALEDLNAMEMDDTDLRTHFDRAVFTGCRIWADVNAKWRNGDLRMDDALVCAMGRLLLLSYRPKAWDIVLSLVEATERVPRMAPAMEHDVTDRRSSELPPPKHQPSDRAGSLALSSMKALPGNVEDPNHLDQFRNIVTIAPAEGSELNSATLNIIPTEPTNNTLSLLMETCQKLRNKRAADSYWSLLTKKQTHGIVPDSDNFHTYLRLLRHFRSSSRALQLIRDEMQSEHMQQKTFWIAVSVCIKDTGNPLAVSNCADIVDLMNAFVGTHVPTVLAYLQFAKSSKDVHTIFKAVTHVDRIVHRPRAKVMPKDREAVQGLPQDRRKELVDLTQCLRDCVAWIERDKKFAQKADQSWKELHERVMRSSSLFGHTRLETGPTDEPNDSTKKSFVTAKVNARSVRRAFAEGAKKEQDGDGSANPPFYEDSMKEARA